MDLRSHWDAVYRTNQPQAVSWYQAEAWLSLELIRRVAPAANSQILDVGGGASTLVDGLLAAGYTKVAVLDVSSAGLEHARARLGDSSNRVQWIEGDILTVELPAQSVDVWHDRAVFHFLTDPHDRQLYVDRVRHAVRPRGYVLIATFAEDGPARCSGLDVQRYAPDALHHEFGADFTLMESAREVHVTPRGVPQAFVYCLCRYEPNALARTAA
jgi:ubiquinone/menaquinone biosynthesis C-methylase UbiE